MPRYKVVYRLFGKLNAAHVYAKDEEEAKHKIQKLFPRSTVLTVVDLLAEANRKK